jgi:thymidylate kinase
MERSIQLTDADDALEGPSVTVQYRQQRGRPQAVELVVRLCDALAEGSITYCHWKSNEGLVHSATGDNDLDLLIGRNDAQRFTQVLHRLGFKEARPPKTREAPGTAHFFGLDVETGRFVHVHAHYQLILGHDTTKNYRLPIEDAYLASTTKGPLFRVPAPDLEFMVFVIRMVLKHSTWDSIICRQGTLTTSERRELEYLLKRVDLDQVHASLDNNLPVIDRATFDRCLKTIGTNSSLRSRVTVARELQHRLTGNARRAQWEDTALRLWRRTSWRFERRALRRPPRKKLTSGGALIAVVGGDGAGKTSAVDELCNWLSGHFMTTRTHLGKPPRSMASLTLKAVILVRRRLFGASPAAQAPPLSVASSELVPGRLWLIRHVLTARDRFRAYVRARRFAAKGGLVVSDRYPLRQIRMMDGPVAGLLPDSRTREPLMARLIHLESAYYRRIRDPDLLVVLRIDPEIAVARRSDEDQEFVRARCREVERVDWGDTPAFVVDAGRNRAEVLSEIKSLVWSRL